MHPLWGLGSLLGVVLVSALLMPTLARITSWSRRRELELLILAAPISSLALSIAGLRSGAGTICFLGPLPVDYRLTIAVAFAMGLMAVLGLAAGSLRLVLLQRTLASRGLGADPRLVTLVARLADQLGIAAPTVRMIVHDRPLALTFGLRRPTILLSSWMLERLDEQELSAVLAHELGHVAQRDYLVVWLATVLRDSFWYLPTSRLAYRRLQQEKEPACDDLAVHLTRRPLALASALAKVWHCAAREPIAGMAQALTGAHASIETRITRLLADAPVTTDIARNHHRTLAVGGLAFATLLALEVANVVVLLAPMGCGAAMPLGKLF